MQETILQSLTDFNQAVLGEMSFELSSGGRADGRTEGGHNF